MSYPPTRFRYSARTLRQRRISSGPASPSGQPGWGGRQLLTLLAILVLCSLPFLSGNFTRAKNSNKQSTAPRQERPERTRLGESAQLNESVSGHASERDNPLIKLSDSHEVLISYEGPEHLRVALEQNRAEPLSLAAADFDEDGVPDLVIGYAHDGRGILSLLRGNVDSIHPNTPEAKERVAMGGSFTQTPFISPAQVFDVSVAVDFIGAGDFDGDGHSDVVTASRSRSSLYLFSGDGHGSFAQAREIALPGLVTAMAIGDLNRPDGLTDVIAGVNGAGGAKVMVFEGPEGALRSSPEIFVTRSPVASLVVGQLDGDQQADLAIAAGQELLVVSGRDRKLSLNNESRALVEATTIARRTFDSPIRALVAGDFAGRGHQDLALLSDDGVVHLLNGESGQQAINSIGGWTEDIVPIAVWPSVIQLVCARVSGLPVDDLIAVDSLGHQLQVLARVPAATGALLDSGEFDFKRSRPQVVSLSEEGTPVAVLPLKVNGDALSDLVVLRSGSSSPGIRISAANAIITVNSTADINTRDDVLTLREAILLANGELLKSSLTAAEQAQVDGTPAPGLDEVRFNIPVNAQASLGANKEVRTANKRTPGKQAATSSSLASATRVNLPELSGNNSYLTYQPAAKTIEATENRSLSFSRVRGSEREYGPRLSSAETGGQDSMAPIQDKPTNLPTATNSIQSPASISNPDPRWRAERLRSMLDSFRRDELFHHLTMDCALSPISINQVVSGSLANTDCQSPVRGSGYYADRYTFTGTANQGVAIRVTGFAGGVIYLVGPDGLVVTSDGAGSYTSTPRIPSGSGFFALPASGTYTIEVTSYFSTSTGSYSLSLTSGTAGCSYGITPSSQGFSPAGGPGSIAVTAGAVCAWTAITDANWVTISGGSGTGNGTVNYTVAVNPSSSPRTASVFVAGLVFNLTQLGNASGCLVTSLNINQVVSGSLANTDCQSPVRGSGYYADRYTFTGTANQGVAIKTSFAGGVIYLLGPDGLVVTSDGAGSYNSTPRIPSGSGFFALPASGTYTIEMTSYFSTSTGSYSLSVTSGTAGCSYGITPSSQSFSAAGGSGSIAVTTGGVCAWTAITDANWVTISGGNSGTGNGTVNYTVAANPSSSPRTASVFVAGLVFNLTQLGASSCMLTPMSVNQVVSGSLANTDCQSPVRGSGYYADRYTFTGTANQGVAIRTSFAGGTIYLLGPDGLVLASDGSSSYTSTPRIPSGSGFLALPATGTYTIEVTSYFSTSTGPYSLSLTSGTAGCSYGITPSSQSFSAAGGPGSIAVTTGATCAWTAITDANWVTITGGSGTGSGTVSYTVATNPSSSPRTASIFVGGLVFNLTQLGASSCTLTPISINQVVSGSLANTDCQSPVRGSGYYADRYTFTGTANQGVAIRVSSSFTGGVLYLLGPDGLVVTSDGAGSFTSIPRIPSGSGFFALPATGTYTIEVTSYFSTSTGSYSLSVTSGTAGCSYGITPSSQSFSAAGGPGTIAVTTGGACAWTAITDANWVTISSGSGTGAGTVSYTVGTNPSSSPRAASVFVGGLIFNLTQLGASSCMLTPISINQVVSGGLANTDCQSPVRGSGYYADRYTFTGTANQGVAIRASSSFTGGVIYLLGPDGLVLASDGAGSFTSIPRIPTAGGFLALPATGTYTIEVTSYFNNSTGSYSLSLTSGTAGCTYGITPSSQSFSAAGGPGNIAVTTGATCAWTAITDANWVTITGGSGTGAGTVSYTVATNPSSSPRTASVFVAGLVFNLTQLGASSCTLTPISINQAVSGSLANTDCQSPVRGSGYYADRYTFTGTANQGVAIRVSTSFSGGVLYLLGPDGSVLTSDGIGSFNNTPRIPSGSGFFALPASGTYTIEVTSYFSTSTGSYSLSLTSGTAGCSYGITPSSQSFNAAGGPGSIAVTTGGACAWTAITDANWVTISSGSGTGAGTVNYTVATNPSSSSRTASVFVAGLVFNLTQLGDASGCLVTSLNINQVVSGSLANTDCQSPVRGSGYFADRYTFTGTANQGVAIRVSSSFSGGVLYLLGPDGLVLTSDGTGSFNNTPRIPTAGGFFALPATGMYTIEVTSYFSTSTGSYSLSLTSGTAGCSYGITPGSQSFNSAGGPGSIAVTTGGACAWTAITDANWVTITGGSGTGAGIVNYTVATNPSSSPRTASVFVGGLIFNITQLGASSCTLTPISINQVVSGGLANTDCQSPVRGSGYFADRYTFTGTANQGVAIRVSSSFSGGVLYLLGPDGLVLTSDGTGSFNNTPRIPAAGGFFALPATGTYTIEVTSYFNNSTGSYSLSLTSGTDGCSYGITPGSQSFNSAGGPGSIAVTTGGACAWTAITDANWVTITGGSGTGAGTVSYTVATNPSSSPRTASVFVGGLVFNITQLGDAGFCAVTPISPGQAVSGSLANTDCQSPVRGSGYYADRYTFTGTANQGVAIRVSSSFTGGVLYLLGPDGLVLTSDGVGSFTNTPRIPAAGGFFALPATGTYTIEVTSYFNNSTGSYSLSLTSGTAGCSYEITPTNQSVGPAGGPGSIAVTTGGSCAWTAITDANWVTITGGSGTGAGTVNYTVAVNPSSSPRTASVFVAGLVFNITQLGDGSFCSLTPITSGQAINGSLANTDCQSPVRGSGYFADRYTFAGTANQGVAISVTSTAFDTFLYLLAPDGTVLAADDDGAGSNSRIPATGSFFTLPSNGTYIFEVTSFFAGSSGNYTLSLTTGQTNCTYNISPNVQNFSSSGGSGSVTVTTASTCGWTASSNAPFLTITSGANTSGSGAVSYLVAANPGVVGRSGTLTIAGQTFTVTQNASPACSFSINPTSRSFNASGGSGTISVTALAGCNWTATSNSGFINVTAGASGSGNGIVSYSVATNTTGSSRTGTVTAAGQVFTVDQSAVSPTVRTITLISPLPKISDPIIIDGTTQPGYAGTPIIEITGVNLRSIDGGNGLNITAGNSTIRGLAINHFTSLNRDSDILLITNGNNTIESCYLGGDATGKGGFVPNGTNATSAGVSIRSSSGNLIGGTTAAARNLISGVDGAGVIITGGATNNLVQGNYIGTDATGSLSLGFQRVGVYVQGASGNTIGGTAAGAGNLISGNIDYGVYLQDDAHNNLVVGNMIGANGGGVGAVPNGNAGVFIYNPTGPATPTLDNTIGGTTPAARNIISGNDPYGIVLGQGATGTLVQGNYIGTKFDGTAALPNTYGITATQATGSTIGGSIDAARNVISGNTLTGISIGFLNNGQVGGTGTTIQRNYIGTNASGTGPVGNQADGVFVEVQSITHRVQENVIAFNGSNGVRIPDLTSNPGTPGFRIQIVDNSIYSNGALGIDLGSAGITPNDPRDEDIGANLLQNFPVLTSFTPAAANQSGILANELVRGNLSATRKPIAPEASLTVSGTLNSTPNSTFTVHWYFSADPACSANQANRKPLVNNRIADVRTDDSGNAAFTIPFDFPVGINQGIINCTATDSNGNTSEFSACLPVTTSSSQIQVTAQTNPVGRSFTVDGATYSGTQNLLWTAGSSHTIGTTSPQTGATGTQYVWSNWSDGGAITHNVAPGSNTTYTANFTVAAPTWEAVVLTASQTEIKTWTTGGRTYAYLKLSFPNAGYRVANWGQATRAGTDFTADASVEKFTGASVQSVTTTAQIYELGTLSSGSYNFTFKNSSALVKTQAFTVSSSTPPPNPIDTAREFVKQQYRDFLNREADQAGEDFWTDNITKCSDPARRPSGQTEAQCTLRQRETTSGAFFRSPEFQYTGYYVLRVYQGALGRQPKLSEFIPDAQFVGAGILVNSQLSAARINQNKADFAAQFVNCTDATKSRCAEFKAIYDGLSNQAYVDRLFQTTGVNASAADRTALVNGLNAIPATETRASVLQKVVDGIVVIGEGNQTFTTSYGQAFYNSESNRAFVQLEYFGYMKRDPDDAGYAFWLGKLNQFNGNFVNAEMVLAFISSPEYRARFGQP